MKIVRFRNRNTNARCARLGVLIGDNTVADLAAGHARMLADRGDGQGEAVAAARFPSSLGRFLSGGAEATEVLRRTVDYLRVAVESDPGVRSPGGEPVFVPRSTYRLLAPSQPSKLIAVGRNYYEHQAETGSEAVGSVPSAWIKANSSICGPEDDIIKPVATRELDYETEFSIVIGRRCKNVSADAAFDVVAGYTIVNDVSARDVARLERKEKNQLLGKMFDTFAPMGPCFVTKDEIRDPMNIRVRTRVNGEVRQDSNTSTTIWTIPQLIAYISQMTLEPGDVITTGTPEGCAMGHEGGDWFLKPGDILESEVEGVGVMRNRIVSDSGEPSWDWNSLDY